MTYLDLMTNPFGSIAPEEPPPPPPMEERVPASLFEVAVEHFAYIPPRLIRIETDVFAGRTYYLYRNEIVAVAEL